MLLLIIPACDHDQVKEADIDSMDVISDQRLPMERIIRVLLADGVDQCRVLFGDPVDIVDSESRELLAADILPGDLEFIFDGSGMCAIRLDQYFYSPSIDLVPAVPGPISVFMPDGIRSFRGSLRLARGDDGKGSVINLVDMEDYLIGVVAAELPRSFHPEAFRVQAIVARTYAWYHKIHYGQRRKWDVRATESSQVYAGLDREKLVPQAAGAVRDTCGLVCTWTSHRRERIFCTYYSSRCGGTTQAAGPVKNEKVVPPLRGNVICGFCRDNPFTWGPIRIEKTILTERLRERYSKFDSIGPIDNLEVLLKTGDGRPVLISLMDAEGGAIELEAENFRLALDPSGRTIKSTMFNLLVEDDAVVLADGRGFGHGMGLCQYGANRMAKDGRKADEILRYYFPTSKLIRAYE